MTIFVFLIPSLILFVFIYAAVKKINVFQAFVIGIKNALILIYDVFPYVCAVTIMSELAYKSGVYELIGKLFAPILTVFGIPKELFPLIILKPFSGSGSLALLSDIYKTYGVDGYISKCASAIFGSSETVFYISAIYFSACKEKRLKKAICISLVSIFISCVFACFICRFL